MKLHRDDCRDRTCRGCGIDSEMNKLKRRVEELEKENAELRRKIEAVEGERAAWEKTAADRLTPELSTIAKQRDELAEENMRLKQEIEVFLCAARGQQ